MGATKTVLHPERAARERTRRAAAKRRGFCQTCQKRRARPKATTCAKCGEVNGRSARRRTRERIAKHQCYLCGVDLAEGATWRACEDCKKKRKSRPSARTNVTRERRKKQGLCRDCGEASAEDSTRCLRCARDVVVKKQVREEERVARGACYRCGKREAPAWESCLRCKKKRRSKKDLRKTPVPVKLQHCGACGEQGHRKATKACPRFAGRPWQRGKLRGFCLKWAGRGVVPSVDTSATVVTKNG